MADRADGFVHLVSLAGITGACTTLQSNLGAFLQRVRHLTRVPLAIGFGVSTPAQAQAVGRVADGVIVGSAMIDAIEGTEDQPRAAGTLARALCFALEPSDRSDGRELALQSKRRMETGRAGEFSP